MHIPYLLANINKIKDWEYRLLIGLHETDGCHLDLLTAFLPASRIRVLCRN
jgi:hypothetical protein